MNEYDEAVLKAFLKQQDKLFPEPVADSMEAAEYFLEDCMATVCQNAKEVLEYFEETGSDISGMSKEEILEADEVFPVGDGRYLIVEG
ncbi:MAG: glyoxalase [Lachnospiraceae bacterium]|nr:glyoxalase [Lachnospiraceae bacterium]